MKYRLELLQIAETELEDALEWYESKKRGKGKR